MSAADLKVYRFATTEQWGACLSDRLAPRAGGGLSAEIALGLHAVNAGVTTPVSAVAVDPFQQPLWRLTAQGELSWRDALDVIVKPIVPDVNLAASPRLLIDGRWLWGFSARQVRRYDRETLDLDRSFELVDLGDLAEPKPDDPVAFLDIALDGHEGLWALVSTRNEGSALVRFDCRGCVTDRRVLPCGVGPASQIAAANCGRYLLLLGSHGDCLWRLRAADGTVEWCLALESVLSCWTASRLTTDGRDRVGLGGSRTIGGTQTWCFLVMDAAGNLLQPPLDKLFAAASAVAAPAPPAPVVVDVALGRAVAYFATDQGLYRLDATEACAAAGSQAVLMSPALYSPITANGRGWLRAELDLVLPKGAALVARVVTTDDPVLKDKVTVIADGTLPAAARQALIWAALNGDSRGRSYTIAGEGPDPAKIAVPLFATNDRWLWLRLELETPAGVEAPNLAELRVLYPELSIVRNLPAIFQGDNDPSGVLRRLAGVLETTTQNIDGVIRGIGSQLDPTTAQASWFDYLAGWVGLPWHQALPDVAKRKMLKQTSCLLEGRGRRVGLVRLLQCLVAPGEVKVVDLTADYSPVRLGGEGKTGAALPGLLAGVPRSFATLGGKAVLGRARLACPTTRCDPLAGFGPEVRIEVTTTAAVKAALDPLLMDILADYVPADLKITIHWRVRPAELFGDTDELLLDGDGPGRIGADSVLGRTVLVGRPGGIGNFGMAMDLQLP